jgi:hypothetical protein
VLVRARRLLRVTISIWPVVLLSRTARSATLIVTVSVSPAQMSPSYSISAPPSSTFLSPCSSLGPVWIGPLKVSLLLPGMNTGVPK